MFRYWRSCVLWGVSLIGVALLCAGVSLPVWGAEPPLLDQVFIAQNDQSEQRYVLILPDSFQSDQPHDLLLALHGHGSDRWQFAKDPRAECRAARDVAAKHSLLYVSPDYRAKTSWMGPRATEDVVQIIAELKAKYRIRRVILTGGSMGGTSALAFAALHPELVDGVAAMNGTANLLEYTQFPEAIQASYGGTKSQLPEVYKARSAEYWPERLTMPVACTTGGKDELVPPDSVLRLVGILKQIQRPVLLLHRPEGGHDTSYDDAVRCLEFAIQRR